MSKATKITIHRADGSVWQAEGKDAEDIDRYWIDLQGLADDHGMPYRGPVMKQVIGPRTGKAKGKRAKAGTKALETESNWPEVNDGWHSGSSLGPGWGDQLDWYLFKGGRAVKHERR